jgi:alpha-amylase/alpha-mannosidase (GH57 family)
MTDARVALILHAYQPPTIGDPEIGHVVRGVYQPLVALHRRLGAPLTLNIQGCLLDRLPALAPAFLSQLRSMIDAGLLDITTSGHYHPLLPLLPRPSRQRQIARNTETITRLLHVTPSGFWPPELAWSPVLAEELAARRIGWTVVDGASLLGAWANDGDRAGSRDPLYLSEELERPYRLAGAAGIVAFPRHHRLSDLLFEGATLLDAARVEAFLLELGGRRRGLVCLAADAERVGGSALRGYEVLLRGLLQPGRLTTPRAMADGAAIEEEVSLPIATWRGDLAQWVRGEGERSFLGELDDARRRFAALTISARETPLATEAGDHLMRAESSCWLYWRVPAWFLEQGFALVTEAHRLMDRM